MDYLGGLKIITRILIRKRGRQEGQRRCDDKNHVQEKLKDACYAAGFKNEERGHKPRVHTASKRWNQQQNEFSSRDSRRSVALPTPWVSPIDTHFRHLASRTVR